MGAGAEAASRDGPGLEEGRPQEELGGGGEADHCQTDMNPKNWHDYLNHLKVTMVNHQWKTESL